MNTSEQPVYDVEIEWRDNDAIAANTHRRQLGTILPGDKTAFEPTRDNFYANPDLDDDSFTVLIFRDAAGVMWTRKLDGDLRELRIRTLRELAQGEAWDE